MTAELVCAATDPEPYVIIGLLCICANCGEPWHYHCPQRAES